MTDLRTLMHEFKVRHLEVTITPQMDDSRSWLVSIGVPTMDGSMQVYFTDIDLEGALQKALDEYTMRDIARDILNARPKHGIKKDSGA